MPGMQRRDFILNAAAAAGGLAAQRGQAFGAKVLRAAVVGCGWFGMVNVKQLMALGQVQVAGLCDPDKQMLDAAAAELHGMQKERPETFADYRQMLKPDRYDIVIVASPDHWHALHAIAGMEAGADLYCEKPISHTLLEGEAMLKTARKLGRVVQIGTQRRSTPHIQQARDFLREGKLGRVGYVRAYCQSSLRGNDNPPDGPAPAHLDWDLWTGPAPLRPYNPLLHPRRWRRYAEYGNGVLGDIGVHMLDLVRWFVDVRWPRRVFSTGGTFVEKQARSNLPDTQTVTYDYDDLTVVWEHRTWGVQEYPDDRWGLSFFGEKGMLRVTGDRWEFRSTDKGAAPQRVDVKPDPDPKKREQAGLAPIGLHMKDLLNAMVSRGRPLADIEEGHISTGLCQLGNISLALGRPITWDGKQQRPVGDAAATRLLARAYRKPWKYPRA